MYRSLVTIEEEINKAYIHKKALIALRDETVILAAEDARLLSTVPGIERSIQDADKLCNQLLSEYQEVMNKGGKQLSFLHI
jgi:hypothetical protein